MAYLKDDPKTDPQDEVQANVIAPGEVVSEEPLLSPGGTEIQSSGAAIAPQQASPQAPLRPSKAGGSRSGFTDVKQYIDKNKPQAQKIAQKAESGITSKAAEIGKQTQARKSALQNVLDRNTAQVGEDVKQAKALVQQQQPLDTAQQQTIKQALGGQFDLEKAPELNLAQQELAAKRLGQSDVSVPTVLQETFARPDRQYTVGQQRLDELLLGGTGAGAQLQTAAQEASKQALSGIAGARQQALAGMAGQKAAREAAGQDIRSTITGEQAAVNQTIQDQIAAAIAARQPLATQAQETQRGATERLAQIQDLYNRDFGNDNSREYYTSLGLSRRGDWRDAWEGKTGADSEDLRITDQEMAALGVDPRYMKNVEDAKYLRTKRDTTRDLLGALSKADYDSVGNYLSQEGLDLGAIGRGEDLTRASVSTPEQAARLNALLGLTGTTEGMILPEDQQQAVSDQALQDFINKYSGLNVKQRGPAANVAEDSEEVAGGQTRLRLY